MVVTVTVIAKDAARFISKCLESIVSISDDVVVVVDDRTTDDTEKIARATGARVIVNKFNNFADQKNFAAGYAKNRWILSLDSDEQVSHSLAVAISSMSERPAYPAYRVPRKNKIFGKYIEHSNWDPNGIIRLYDSSHGHWEGEVHEELVIDGVVGSLYDPLHHDNYRTVEDFLTRQNYYSTLKAQEMHAKGIKFTPEQFVLQPIIEFVRRYFVHSGFMDGLHGLFLSYLMAIYHAAVWIKLWQKSKTPS